MWHKIISHILTSEDVYDIIIESNIIKRKLHSDLKIWILSSRGENNIINTFTSEGDCFFQAVSLWRRANARNVRPYSPYWQYTDLSIFRFVSLLCLRSTLYVYIYICIYMYIYIYILYTCIWENLLISKFKPSLNENTCTMWFDTLVLLLYWFAV